jgi:hypothetical protein
MNFCSILLVYRLDNYLRPNTKHAYIEIEYFFVLLFLLILNFDAWVISDIL